MSMYPDPAAPSVHHEWVAAPGDAARLARAATLSVVRRPTVAVCLAIPVVYVVVRAVLLGPDAWLAAGIAFPVVFIGLLYAQAARGTRASMVPGSRWVSGFGEHELMIGTPIGRTVLPYRSVKGIRRAGPLVLVTVAPRRRLGFPAPLFPPAAVDFVRARIAHTT
ncbi:hypothetical protein [Tsukamurella soli]|uniref:PH domain-containing protein n=1 Tax=Tsukamurella soli TaxID=644556 RepID=A0ABP8J4K3_9ACTN